MGTKTITNSASKSNTNVLGRTVQHPRFTLFTWVCDRDSTSTNTLDIAEVKFGDGYSHRAPKSINPNIQSFSLSFKNREKTQIDDIISFFRERGGYLPFNWVDPGSVSRGCPTGAEALKVICKSWNTSVPTAGVQSLNATFERVYN